MKIVRFRNLFLGSIVILASFAYGFIAANYEVFPYQVIKFLYGRTKSSALKSASPNAAAKGRWKAARTEGQNNGLTKEQQEALSNLSTLGYLKGYKMAPKVQNVTIYEERAAYNGLNFVVSGHAPEAFLMDMKGNILHKWSYSGEDVWPGLLDIYQYEYQKTFWRRAHLLNNGGVLAIFEGIGIIKLDKDSNLLWSYKGRANHHLCLDKNGNIYLLTRQLLRDDTKLQLLTWAKKDSVILEDMITILSPEGKEIKQVSLIDCFLNSDYASLLEHMKLPLDPLHANTIVLIEDDKIASKFSMLKKGNVLISLRNIHTIAVVDLEQEKVTWALTGMWKYQHQPVPLENGNLLIFDNLGHHGKSRVIEFNPLTQKIAWSYKGQPADKFYTHTCGSNQRLPNGNTLIIESDNGRAFEVTPAGKIVWEYVNPYRAGENNELIATLFDVIRFEPNQFSGQDWLSLGTKTDGEAP